MKPSYKTLSLTCRIGFLRKFKISAKQAGFSLVELLVALSLTAAVITVAVIIFQLLSASGGTRQSYGSVTIGKSASNNFYQDDSGVVQTFFAPNYGRVAQADMLRTQLLDDLEYATAVYALGREHDVLNEIRPKSIPVSTTFRGDSLDTPEKFRIFLEQAIPNSTTFTTDYTQATNASIFILRSAQSPRPALDDSPAILPQLAVLAVYDIDLLSTTSPLGTYVSVRRYAGGGSLPTDYYDIFYPAVELDNSLPFNPLVAWFGRASVQSANAFQVAKERPFYFMWWPDPASLSLEVLETDTFPPEYDTDDPRFFYKTMGGRTSLFFVLPMFPAL